MATIIGIDLGTSTTEAAVIRDGKPMMLQNGEGQVVIPSAVGVDGNGNFVVGEKARAQYLLEPENTVIEVKRKMGTSERIQMGGKDYTPVELSAMLLGYVKDYVSKELGEDVTEAVISVPAYFDDRQRQATVEAGKQAGFTVRRILNEPTAAALSYGISHLEEESHILVYDLGGGTFDVTMLEMFGGVLEVKASSGDNMLGGKDFDEALISWLISQFRKKHNIDLAKDVRAMVKLKEKAEWCKMELSEKDSCQIVIPFIAESKSGPLALEETVTAEKFEELIAGLVERTHQPIDVVIADSRLAPEDIDQVLLVGGSTRIPLVKRDIKDYLGIEPSLALNPDFAVAEGAAIQAGILAGSIPKEEGLVMTDVNPYTLGIRIFTGITDDGMSVVIPRNVTIPVVRRETYYTCADYQTQAEIKVYQGESRIASHNHFLGDFLVQGIPPKRANEEAINVEFSYDLNGMLQVSATIASTGESASIDINMMEAKPVEEFRADVSKWKEAPDADEFRSLIRRAERALRKPEVKEDPFLCEDLEDMLYYLKKAIIDGDIDAATDLEQEITDILREL